MKEEKRKILLILILLILAFISLTSGLSTLSLRFEEPRRVIIAYEMIKRGSYLQPTFLGENYYKKPPLFSWLLIASSRIFGWNELTVRVISISFTMLTAATVFLFSFYISGKILTAILSSVIYITFSDILYWYGWLGEIDTTLTFFIFLMIIFQYLGFEKNSKLYIFISGILCGIAFMIKGFPAFGFFALTYFALSIYRKRIDLLITPSFLICCLPAFIIPILWIINTDDPYIYLNTLFMQSLLRVSESKDAVKFVFHLIKYPLLNVKQTLPTSIVLIYLLIKKKISLDEKSRMIMLIFIINYTPYLLSAGSNGRYIIPIFPLLSIVSANIIIKSDHIIQRSLYLLIIVSIIGRALYGLYGLPAIEERKGSPRDVAIKIANIIDKEATIAFDCKRHKSICAYIDIYTGKVLVSPDIDRSWDYVISCSGRTYDNTRPAGNFFLNRDRVDLLRKDSAD